VVAGDWEDASSAIRAGDYQKAFRLWKPFAELSVIKTFGTCDPVSNGRIWLI